MSRPQLDSQRTLGLYGKLPIFGDFVIRQLNSEFVNPWDLWMQEGLTRSRQILGDAWLNYYLEAPIWRFVLGAGTIGYDGWIGIVIPSVDRVGRYFPLTLARPINPDVDITATYMANNSWFNSLEELGVLALSQDLNFATFELQLRETAAPAVLIDNDTGDETIPSVERFFLSCCFNLSKPDTGIDWNIRVSNAIAASLKPASLWGTQLLESQTQVLLATEALPDKDRFCALLDKKFTAHGWNEAMKLPV